MARRRAGVLPLADAYLAWARRTAFRDAKPLGVQGPWQWLLLELTQPAAEFAQKAATLARDDLRVPAHYLAPPRGLEHSRHCTAACSPRFLDALAGKGDAGPWQGLVASIVRFEIGFLAASPPDPAAVLPARRRRATGDAGVVVGIVDDGIGFANARFRTLDGASRPQTRLLAFWDQGHQDPAGGAWVHGRSFDRAALQTALRKSLGASAVPDEALLYASLGYREVRHRVTHGTHVMDLACGADPGDAFAPPIVAVQLPGSSIADTSCASSTVYMLDAIRFVLATADESATGPRVRPVVINLSIGNIAGPHDGSSIFEAALDEIIASRGDCHVVMAAGNSYLSRCHAWIDLPAEGGEMDLRWQIQPGDGTPSYLELWFSDPASVDGQGVGDIDGVRVTVTPPAGEARTIGRGEAARFPRQGEPFALFTLEQRVANGRRAMGLLAVAPTVGSGEWKVPAPSGAWRVTLRNEGTRALECNAYVQRDDAPLGRPTQGRQSYLVDPDYERFDRRGAVQLRDSSAAFVRRIGTLNGLASGALVHVAGGARTDREGGAAPARYSSVPLPTADQDPAGPRLRVLATTEDSDVLHGVLAAGTASGSCVALSGTSMAAPQLTRLIAEELARAAPPRPLPPVLDRQDEPIALVPPAATQRLRWSRRRGELP